MKINKTLKKKKNHKKIKNKKIHLYGRRPDGCC